MILKDGTKYRMNRKEKKQWISALRSGKYRQKFGSIGTKCNRCALGVAVAEGLTKPVFGIRLPVDFLPYEVQKVIGIMNDRDHKRFSTIAKWIEENL